MGKERLSYDKLKEMCQPLAGKVGVYAIHNAQRCLYVGQALSFTNRTIGNYERFFRRGKLRFDYYEIKYRGPVTYKKKANKLERDLIHKLNPTENQTRYLKHKPSAKLPEPDFSIQF